MRGRIWESTNVEGEIYYQRVSGEAIPNRLQMKSIWASVNLVRNTIRAPPDYHRHISFIEKYKHRPSAVWLRQLRSRASAV